MNATDAKVGHKYLSAKGTPVIVTKHKGDRTMLKVEVTGNEIEVAKNYELKPFSEAGINKDTKILMRANGHSLKRATPKKPRKESLSAIIDPMLFAGGKTVKEIAEMATKHASDLAKGKDVEANVRARMVSFSRKEWKIEKNDKKHVRVIKPK